MKEKGWYNCEVKKERSHNYRCLCAERLQESPEKEKES